MSVNTDWDVEKHKVEYECDEHWELRKTFLKTHKDRFPEDELVCLAQVFTNVELLGCRYPKETMDLIAELSQDVAKDYRERQKTKLKRTFVKASDAASSKVKGLTPAKSSSTAHPLTSNSPETSDDDTGQSPCKKARIDTEQPYGDFILIQHPNEGPLCVVEHSTQVSTHKKVEWKLSKNNNECRCEMFINSKKLADGVGSSKKAAKTNAAQKAFEILRKYYYLIEVKKIWSDNLNSNTNLKPSAKGTDAEEKNAECLSNDNVGAKLMKLMGWAGGGLGKSQQGITEPITVSSRISRLGFGTKLSPDNKAVFRKKCREILHQFIHDSSMEDLVITDFDKEERAMIHEMAGSMGLKSRSRGSENQRILMISRKIDLKNLVQELLDMGGSTDKYELKPPTG